jgi:nitrate/TMAO reductase-like tetraheme cytochrome c subunit
MPTVIVLIFLAITLMIAGLLVVKPDMTAARGGKILAFLGLFIFPALAGLLGFDDHLERSKQTRFCLSCHIMAPYGQSLLIDNSSYIPAVHFQNNLVPRDQACYTCHTDYTLYTGGIKAKIRGLRHIYVQYLGRPRLPIKLYQPFSNRVCLHCHLGARTFEEGPTHSALMDDIKENKISCVSSGCHDVVHNVSQLSQMKFWSPGQ